MASWNLDFPDDFLKDFLEDKPEFFFTDMVNAALPILEQNMRSELANHADTGDMCRGIKGYYRVRRDKNNGMLHVAEVVISGNSTHTYGKNKYTVSNALKAIWLENGTVKQPARPFLEKVVKKSEPAVIAELEKVYDRRLKGVVPSLPVTWEGMI